MAYVNSWYAHLGTVQGQKNNPQKLYNTLNYHQQLTKNDTIGYYKPPFCQWPRGGSTKSEAKFRIKAGELSVKPGTDETPAGDDFYFRINQYSRPVDEDGQSVHSQASTSLGMQTNICTRTFGPHRHPIRLPGSCTRTKYNMRPAPHKSSTENYYKYHTDLQYYDLFGTMRQANPEGYRSPRMNEKEMLVPYSVQEALLRKKAEENPELTPAIPGDKDIQRPVQTYKPTPAPVKYDEKYNNTSKHKPPKVPYLHKSVLSFRAGADKPESESPAKPTPTWRMDHIPSAATFMNPKLVEKRKARRKRVEEMYEDNNDKFIFFD